MAVDWPSGAALRAALGLPPTDFHITLGFFPADVHGVPKGAAQVLPPPESSGRIYAMPRAAFGWDGPGPLRAAILAATAARPPSGEEGADQPPADVLPHNGVASDM